VGIEEMPEKPKENHILKYHKDDVKPVSSLQRRRFIVHQPNRKPAATLKGTLRPIVSDSEFEV
jgi:hypothetical protein